MSTRLLFQIVAGCLIGLALGAAMIYGLVRLANWFVGA
jgi:hypothetical protein